MELRQITEMEVKELPYLKSPIEVMEHALKTYRDEKNPIAYASSFQFTTNVVNEPIVLALLQIKVKCYRLTTGDKNQFLDYLHLWADTYNMASMENRHDDLDLSLGNLLTEYERYIEGKGVWHEVVTFAKFLNY